MIKFTNKRESKRIMGREPAWEGVQTLKGKEYVLMKILIEGKNLENYYAKEHESFKNGLKALFDARCYGEGYPGYDENIRTFTQMKEAIFPNEDIQLLILFGALNPHHIEDGFAYEGLSELKCKKAILLNDFWSEAEAHREAYFRFVEENNIDYVISLFRAPFHMWEGTPIHDRLIFRPTCIDPKIFNDWGCKKYDVGNLNAGIFGGDKFYPERAAFHNKLLEMDDISYFYAKHPGSGMHAPETPLIGKNFSIAINQCKIFVTSGNLIYRNFACKHAEIMASNSLMMSNEPMDAEMLGLIDGVNYVTIDETNIQDKIRYYLAHEDERLRIAQRGYALVMERYTSFAVAAYVYRQILEKE